MSRLTRIALLGVTSLLVAGCLGAAASPAPSAVPSGAATRTVSVTGEGRISVAPDRARVEIGVVLQRPTVKEAQAAAATAMTAVIASLRAHGIPDAAIQTTVFTLAPQYEYPTPGTTRLTGYQLTNIVRITIDELDQVGAIVDDAMAAGATTVSSIGFTVADLEPIAQQARAAAVVAARSRAETLAKAAGVQLGGVVSITETGTTTPEYRDSKEGSAPTPIQPGRTEVVVTVSVVFEISG